ncbi:MAG: nuclear transport factor 2 family protein [Acidobacteriota bacterium]
MEPRQPVGSDASEEAAEAASIDEELAVAAANERFYSALESGDLVAMEDVWLHADWVKCVHPGWELIIGWEGVNDSWRRIFENSGGMRVSAREVRIKVTGDFSWVSCTENLAIFLDNSSAPITATTAATNLFYRVNSAWLMVHHHASPTPASEMIASSGTIQ